MSFGIGLGAFMQGMGQGMAMGRTINDVRERAATREAAQGAFRQSSKEREVAIADAMAGGAPAEGAPPAAPEPVTAPQATGGQGLPPVAPAAPGATPARRGDAPQAVTDGINARAALDPNSPTYPQDIARVNDGVVGATMRGARTARPAGGSPREQTVWREMEADLRRGGMTLDEPTPAAAPRAATGPAPTGLPPVPRGPISREQAEREVGSVFDFYMQRGAPRVVEQMLANGNVEQAQQFQTWIRGEGVQRGMRSWAGAIRAAQTGDADAFLRHARAAYNNDAYSPDGQSVTASRVLRNSEGGVTGMELTVRGRDGTESVQRFNGAADLYRQAITFLAPEQQFQHYARELTAAREAATRTELANRTRRAGNEDFVFRASVTDGIATNRAVEGERRAATEYDRRQAGTAATTAARDERAQRDRLELAARQSALREAEKLAAGTGESVASVQTRIETVRNNMASRDYPGAGFNALSPDQQLARAVEELRRQRSAAASIIAPAAPAAPGRPTPVSPPRAAPPP